MRARLVVVVALVGGSLAVAALTVGASAAPVAHQQAPTTTGESNAADVAGGAGDGRVRLLRTIHEHYSA